MSEKISSAPLTNRTIILPADFKSSLPILDFDSDDLVDDTEYIPKTSSQSSDHETSLNESDEAQDTHSTAPINETVLLETNDNIIEPTQFTKSGALRKTRKYPVSLKESTRNKENLLWSKYFIKTECDEKCIKNV